MINWAVMGCALAGVLLNIVNAWQRHKQNGRWDLGPGVMIAGMSGLIGLQFLPPGPAKEIVLLASGIAVLIATALVVRRFWRSDWVKKRA